MGILLRIALNNLIAAKRRTLFLGGALFLVTLFFVMLLALTAGVTDNLIEGATNISSGHVNIGGYFKTTPSDSQVLVQNVSQLKKEAKLALPEATKIVDRMRGWGKIISEQGTQQLGINGVDFDDEGSLFGLLKLAPAKEYLENPADPLLIKGDLSGVRKKGGVIVFASTAKRLKVDVGDGLTLRSEALKGQTNTVDGTIVAIASDLGLLSSFASFVSKDTVAELYQYKDDVSGVVQIYLPNIDDSEKAMNRLREHLSTKGYDQLEHDGQPFFIKLLQTVPNEDWVGAKLDVTTWADESSFLTQIIVGLRALSFAIVFLLAIVIIVGITNTMTIAVRERTREIGTLRAIGMMRSRVLWLFMLEAMILGVLASGLGALFGVMLAQVIDAAHIRIDNEAMRTVLLSDTIHLVTRFVDVLTAVATLTIVTTVAAFFPSLRAARITPVTAMQSAE
jgi:putative ABC transport system permease protein